MGAIAVADSDPNIVYVGMGEACLRANLSNGDGVYKSVYGGSYFGLMTRYDHRTGEVRNITPWPDYPGGRTAAQVKYRFQLTYPIIISPHDSNTIYAGANVLFRSTTEGRSWDIISPDLTRDDTSRQNGGRLEEYYCVIFALAESPKEQGAIWAGSDDGLVHQTRDSGKTWTLATSGIPADTFVRTVREDPNRRGLLYAGTETGVYVSFDDGENWQSLQLNLPIVPIPDLTVRDNDLIAATQGRAFWILDDVTPLQQASDAAEAVTTFLFETEHGESSRQAEAHAQAGWHQTGALREPFSALPHLGQASDPTGR